MTADDVAEDHAAVCQQKIACAAIGLNARVREGGYESKDLHT